MAPLPGYPGGGRFPSQLSAPLLLLLLSLSKVRGDCTHPHVANATLRSGDPKDSYPAGTVLQYDCSPGYEPIPGETHSLTCLATSKWSIENPKFCQGRRCPTVDLEDGRIVKSNDMRLGDEITLECNEGYRLIGQNTLRCVLIGSKVDWDERAPFCHRIRCYPPPNIRFGSHSGRPFEEFQYGSSVTYTCRPRFSLIGSWTSKCSTSPDGKHGEWHPPAPECKVIRCREPEIKNGRVTTKPQPYYTYEDRAEFECDPGYIMVGNSTCICGPDHGWIPRFPTCVMAGPTTMSTTRGGGGGGEGDGGGGGGGDDALDPENGPTHSPETTPPGDETGSVVVILAGLCLIAGIWKYRSHMKTGEAEAPTSPGEFSQSVSKIGMEPKHSELA